MSLLAVAGANSAVAGGYDIDNSLKFEEDNLELLYKTFSGEGTGAGRTFTISTWCKRTELGGIDIIFGFGRDTNDYGDGGFRINSDQIQLVSFPYSGGVNSYNIRSTQVLRDTSAWYHLIAAVDTTQATTSDRVRLYVNGTEITDFTTSDYPAQNFQWKVGRAEEHMIGNRPDASATEGAGFSTQNFSGYMAEFYFVDGQSLAPTDFGEFDEDTGIWKPKAYTGSYGTNGFYLDFENSASLGADGSGNGNNFTLNNITSADQATDTPTNNFATLNPLLAIDTAWTYTDGATSGYDAGGDSFAEGTIGFTNGKWYYEIVQPAESGNPSANMMMGYGRPNLWGTTSNVGGDTYSFAYNRTGVVFYNGTTTSGWSAYSKDDVVMVAIDTTNGFAYFGVNGTWGNGGVPTSGASGTGAFDYDSLVTNISVGDLLIPALAAGNAGNIIEVNFGGFTEFPIASGNTDENGYGNFEYAPPSGYYALCSKNLAEFG